MKALTFAAPIFVCSLLILFTSSAFAHDGEWGSDSDPCVFYDTGSGVEQEFLHEDEPDYKGWAKIWLWNLCSETDWGDFHLKIKGLNIADVDFLDGDSGGFDPQLWIKSGGTYTQVIEADGLWWNIINDATNGSTMDIYFYDTPIEHGDQAWLKVYTDNTTRCWSFFTVCAYPTPVPEPATIMLLGLGTCGLLRRRKRA